MAHHHRRWRRTLDAVATRHRLQLAGPGFELALRDRCGGEPDEGGGGLAPVQRAAHAQPTRPGRGTPLSQARPGCAPWSSPIRKVLGISPSTIMSEGIYPTT